MKKITLFMLLCCTFMPLAAQLTLIPIPSFIQTTKGSFTINAQTQIKAPATLQTSADMLRTLLYPATGFRFDTPSKEVNYIELTTASTSEDINKEGYRLVVKPTHIQIKATNYAGFFNAFQTLMQLLPHSIYSKQIQTTTVWKIQAVNIKDSPQLAWRGAMLDVSRQFFEFEYLKKYIDWLAFHKLNVFHLHLTDDEGWRIEIKSLPKLTELGAWRGPNELLPPVYGSGNKRYGGFYTQNQLKELVQYASQRNITIVPEIDIPGHSRAVAIAYPEILCNSNDTSASVQGIRQNVWCAARDENYQLLDQIISEVASIFPSEYIHIGGDEVNHKAWDHCDRCKNHCTKHGYNNSSRLQSYFIMRIQNILAKHYKKMMGWDEILDTDTLHSGTCIMAWTGEKAGFKAMQQKQFVVMSPAQYLYLDMAQGQGERGHWWATRLPIERLFSYQFPTDSISKIYLKGIQANLWSEYLDQPLHQADYQSYPRLVAVAEMAWTGNAHSFKHFNDRLNNAHYNRLYEMGIHFRLPAPIVAFKKGKAKLQYTVPNSDVFYSIDSSTSTLWKPLEQMHLKGEDIRRYKFRAGFNNLYSPATEIAYDTLTSWTEDIIRNQTNDSTLTLNLTTGKSKMVNPRILFKYLYGATALNILKIEIRDAKQQIYEKRYAKPMPLSSRDGQFEIKLDKTLNKRKTYQVVIHTTKRTGTDSYGVVQHIPDLD